MSSYDIFVVGITLAGLAVITVIISVLFRKVVSTNTVHIVQSRNKTQPYGTGQAGKNVYYKWPSWVPFFGVTVIELPVSNFDVSLQEYEAYDKDRVPFMVDIVAFFRIVDTAIAAQRVHSVEELRAQLKQIVQGAVRKVLASAQIDKIMLERAQFGLQFTEEVQEQLKQWGVEPVKAMELMDIRDGHDSKVISNIMAKKTSHIQMESRVEVAKNMQTAQTAEIEAKQGVDIRAQEAEQKVGERTAEKTKLVGVAEQKSRQEVLDQEKDTATKTMAVKQVELIRQAEITRDAAEIAAKQDKQVNITEAEGLMEAKKREAEGVQAFGEAEGKAMQAKLMAPVNAQISLAEKIASLEGYQRYLMVIEAVRAYMAVGTKQAEALQKADIKVIANTGKPTEGVGSVMDLFTSKGGTDVAAMVEAIAQSPFGKSFLANLGIKESLVTTKTPDVTNDKVKE